MWKPDSRSTPHLITYSEKKLGWGKLHATLLQLRHARERDSFQTTEKYIPWHEAFLLSTAPFYRRLVRTLPPDLRTIIGEEPLALECALVAAAAYAHAASPMDCRGLAEAARESFSRDLRLLSLLPHDVVDAVSANRAMLYRHESDADIPSQLAVDFLRVIRARAMARRPGDLAPSASPEPLIGPMTSVASAIETIGQDARHVLLVLGVRVSRIPGLPPVGMPSLLTDA